MEKFINGCIDCPFRYSDYNEFSIGSDTLEICVLTQFMNTRDSFIDDYDSVAGDSFKGKTPAWCPLKEFPVTIKYTETLENSPKDIAQRILNVEKSPHVTIVFMREAEGFAGSTSVENHKNFYIMHNDPKETIVKKIEAAEKHAEKYSLPKTFFDKIIIEKEKLKKKK